MGLGAHVIPEDWPYMVKLLHIKDEYLRPDETVEVRRQPNRGWKSSAGGETQE